MGEADEAGPHTLLSPGEAEEILKDHFLHDLPNAAFSTMFLRQLRELRDGRVLDTFQIADEIKRLEGAGRGSPTKPATPFKRPPLEGLWHQHFANARFILQNIGARWNLGHGGNDALEQMIDEEFASEESGVFTDALAARLAHRITVEAFQDRAAAGRMTGEWIVFAKHEGKRFYLTIATHKEGDDRIHERLVRYCQPEFPFLALA